MADFTDLQDKMQELQEWARIHLRRATHHIHALAAESAVAGPISFLAVACALGAALTLTTLYTSSFAVTVDGKQLGVVADQSVVEDAVANVEHAGSTLLGYQYEVDSQVDYQFALTLKTDLTPSSTFEDYFYAQLDKESSELRKYQVLIDGDPVGVVSSQQELDSLLAEMKAEFSTEHTISAEFDHKVDVKYIYMTDHVMDREELREALSANTTGETTYSVVQGDTFGAIAYANDMSITDLQQLNPDVDINRLMIGDVLNVKEEIPVLGVVTVDEITYTEAIPCPVEEVKDDTMYIGASKILVQGEEGESLVTAQVTYVNGKESERDIQSKETVREPTTTTKAVGTKEKPKTASTGQFSWPISGRINSYFGGRYIFGRYSYHSGLDIQASYGASIKAADGGTVTFAGWKGSYGNLVIITHDNGIQTYYAHNSSLLVSAGSKVYKGQVIAKAGSTGRSTGPHCHFEVRYKGERQNPMNYLP